MNPYTSRSMIRDSQIFFGRTVELHEIYTRLQNTQSCSIVGPRRIGKSSLLYHLSRPATYQTVLPDAERYVFAFIDLQELAGLGPEDFFLTAIERLQRAGRGRLEIDIDRDGTQQGFRRFLGRTQDDGLRLVLCCDEFEMLSQNSLFGTAFFAYLRAMCSNYNLAMLTSSRNSLYDLCHQGDLQSSQFWNIFVELPLGLMPIADAKLLISQPFDHLGHSLSTEQERFALEAGGGYPFFTQIACYHLFEAQQAGVPNLAQVKERFLLEATPHFNYAWEQLDMEERSAVVSLAHSPGCVTTDAVFRKLARQALVYGTPGSPALFSNAFREFVVRQESSAQSTGQTNVNLQPSVDVALPSIAKTEPMEILRKPKGSAMQYMDFDVLFERVGQNYRARVINSPSGQASANFSLPFSELELENFYLRIGRPRSHTRRADAPETDAARNFGQRLFKSAFPEEIYHCLRRSLDESSQHECGLRIRLRLEDVPELADLPWEYLYDPTTNRFLALSIESPIVRYLELPERIRPLAVKPPIKVLAMISSPIDYPALDVECEWQNLKNALTEQERLGLVQVTRLPQASLPSLLSNLRRETYHIFHFIGHGGYDPQAKDGVLVLQDEAGRGRNVSGQHLGLLLHDEHFLLAVLNACEGARSAHDDPFAGVAQSLVQQGVPAVVAMQFEITDHAAVAFSHGFYMALADGYPVDAALSETRKSIFATCEKVEWGTPVLYLRSDDGKIFNLQETKP